MRIRKQLIEQLTCGIPRGGFTIIELGIVLAVVLIIAALAIPNLIVYRRTAIGAKCSANLRSIFSAAMAYREQFPSVAERPAVASLTVFLQNSAGTVCPLGGQTYTLLGNRWKPTCPNGPAAHTLTVATGHYLAGGTD